MRSLGVAVGFMLGGLALDATPARAQQAAEPAPPAAGNVPPVDVVQKPKAAKAAAKSGAQKKSAAKSAPVSEPVPQAPATFSDPIDAGSASANAVGYPIRGQGAAARAQDGALSPVDPSRGIVPGNLDRYPGAATRVDNAAIDQQRPFNTNEILTRAPGVTIVNDDGFARHGGIGLRGSPARRSRKVLVLEDGNPINMSLYIDPSTHYVPPADRVQSVEVLRGAQAAYGPNNNHGVVNFVNLSPFGANETELEFSFGTGGSNTRHAHTRQTYGNVGVVASYTGANVDGAWDNERLRYNDFFGAIGWKGVDQDFTISALYFRQRDNYDESNFENEDDDFDQPGDAERLFFNQIGHCKTCFSPGSEFNTYNADVARLQAAHNYYIDSDTTLSTRLYGTYHRRDRYQSFDEDGPRGEEIGDDVPFGTPVVEDDGFLVVPEGVMLGRLRTYETYGADVRAEFANRPFLGGLRQDIQIGAKYEFNDFTNRNFFGVAGQILNDGDKEGFTAFDREYDAHGISTFMQSVIHVTPSLKVVPGVRFEYYDISRLTMARTQEEGGGEDGEDCVQIPGTPDECTLIPGFSADRVNESFDRTNVLPSLSFAWTALNRSTVYGGYHRGLTMHVLREERIPPGEELGDNFQLGFRSKAVKGFTFDLAGFHSQIDDYQIKGSSVGPTFNNVFSTADRVEINGFEVEGLLESRPFTGGPWNFFAQGVYTYSDSEIKKGSSPGEDGDPDVDLGGNKVPEIPRHVAALSLGFAHAIGVDASVTYTYRGRFFADEFNTPYGGDPEGEDGEVPDIWLLSARANFKIPNTKATLFVHGENLTDELYITDREDGIKPGQGRTVFGGMNIKF